MIQANELRIGNAITLFDIGRAEKVSVISNKVIQVSSELLGGEVYHLENVNPIEITKEWMLKFGFEAFPWGWVKKSKSDFGVRLKLTSFSYDVSGNFPVRLKYVHQLQNLYFALTGEELVVPNGA